MLDVVNIDAYAKFGHNPSKVSQDIEWKRKCYGRWTDNPAYFIVWLPLFEPRHEKTFLCHLRMTKAQSPRSLISAFVVHRQDSIIPLVSISEISSL